MAKILKEQAGFKDLWWVLKARCKDRSRWPVYRYLYVNENEVACTDGKHLHLTKYEGLENGFYEIVKITNAIIYLEKMIDNPGKFPDYKNVLPEDSKIKMKLNFSANTSSMISQAMMFFGSEFKDKKSDRYIDFNYLKDALSNKSYDGYFLHFYQETGVHKITFGDCVAIIIEDRICA